MKGGYPMGLFSKKEKPTAEQRTRQRQHRYYKTMTGSVRSTENELMDLPGSLRRELIYQQGSVTDEAGFRKMLELVLAQDRQEKYYDDYLRMTEQEKNVFISALANRDILDKTKGSRIGKGDQVHVDQQGYESAVSTGALHIAIPDAQMGNGNYKEDWSESQRGNSMYNLGVSPETYAKAARALTTHQISDKDGETLSERQSLTDVKLVRRAFQLVAEARKRADRMHVGGQIQTQISGFSGFDKRVSMQTRLQAASVSDLETFCKYYAELQELNGKHNTDFDALDETEKRLFIYALANPKIIQTENLLFRGYSDDQRTARTKAKSAFSRVGEVYDDPGAQSPSNAINQAAGAAGAGHIGTAPGMPSTGDINAMTLAKEDYAKAAMTLLAKKGGVLDEHVIGYDQRMIHLAMRFAKAAALRRIEQLELQHKGLGAKVAGKSDDEKSNVEKLLESKAGDISTEHKLTSRATRLHYERTKLRLDADKVKDMDSFITFLEKAMEGDELLSKFKALDDNQKILAAIGLSRRSVLDRTATRSRMRGIQWIVSQTDRDGKKVDNAEGRQKLLRHMHRQRWDGAMDNADKLGLDPDTAKAAALNLIGKKTQGLFSFKNNVDRGLMERALGLVKQEERMRREDEEKLRTAKNSALRERALEAGQAGLTATTSLSEMGNVQSGAEKYRQEVARTEQLAQRDMPGFVEQYKQMEKETREKALAGVSLDGYESARTAKRETLLSADEVVNKEKFDQFLAAYLTKDEQGKALLQYQKLSERDQYYLIKSLAHRSTLDRDKDKGLGKGVGHGIALGLSLGIAHVKTGHAYEDRKGREALKASYKRGNTDEAVTLTKEEYAMAARALVSEKTRNAIGASAALHIGRNQLDVALLERGFKLIGVMRDKRDEFLRAKLNVQNQKIYGEKDAPKITNRTNTEQLELLEKVHDSASFFEFLKSLGSIEYAEKYARFDEAQKYKFIYALINRDMVDKKTLGLTKRSVKDAKGREQSVAAFADISESDLSFAGGGVQPQDFYIAAVELASGRTRTFGTHRVAWRKSGALDEGLMDRAFLFVQDSDRSRQSRLDEGRSKTLAQDIKLSPKVGSALKDQALNVKDVNGFAAFLKNITTTAKKEKYLYLFHAYQEPEQKLFILAMRFAKDSKAAAERLAGKKRGDLAAKLEIALIQYKKNGDIELGETDCRNAAAMLLEGKVEHDKFNSEAFKNANLLVQTALHQRLEGKFEQAGAQNAPQNDPKPTLEQKVNRYEKTSGGTGYEQDEFSRTGRFGSNAAGTALGAKTRSLGRGIRNKFISHSMWRQEVGDSIVQGEVQGVGEKVKRGAKTEFMAYTHGLDALSDSRIQDAGKRFVRKVSSDGAVTLKGFVHGFTMMAQQEKHHSAAQAVKQFTPAQMQLFINALASRNALTKSENTEKQKSAEGEYDEFIHKDEVGRNALIDSYVSGTLDEGAPGADALKKASEALFSAEALHENHFGAQAFTRYKKRVTFIDWELVENAIALVTMADKERRFMEQIGSDAAAKSTAANEGDKARVRQVFRNTGDEKEGAFDKLVGMGMGAYGVGMPAMDIYFAVDKIYTGAKDMAKDNFSKSGAFAPDLIKNTKDAFSGTSENFLANFHNVFGQAADFYGEVGKDLMGLKNIIQVVTSAVGLGFAADDYLTNQNDMQQFILSNLTEGGKDLKDENVVLDALYNAFGAVKEQKARGIAESVFNLLTNIIIAGGSISKLAGVPAPLANVISNSITLILKVGAKITQAIIGLVQGDMIGRYFDMDELTRQYNQRVRAQNLFRSDRQGKNSKVKELSGGEVRELALRKMGFSNEQDCKLYVCKNIAAGTVYAYHSDNVPDNQRMGARSTAMNMGAVLDNGQVDHRKLIQRLMSTGG